MERTGRLQSTIAEMAHALESRVAFRAAVIRLLDHEVGYTDAMFHLLDPAESFDRGAYETAVMPEVIALAAQGWRTRYQPELAPMWALAEQQGGVVVDTLAIGPDSRSRLRFYSEIVPQTGITHFLWCPLQLHGEPLAYVVMARRGRCKVFSDAAQQVMRDLRATLAVADGCYRTAPRVFDDALRERLTARELEIVDLVMRGLTNPEIALALNLSLHTVRNHLHAVFRKLSVTTRAELAGLVAGGRCD